jgi:SAM-dependent methyltransferase
MSTVHADVPSPIDLRCMADAREWAETAMVKRPMRAEVFTRLAEDIAAASPPVRRVLELGSGPGFLAQHLLQALPQVSCVLLDFSPAMHILARERLGTLGDRAEFVERSFKAGGWGEGLGTFDAIVTLQAVHELRHKRHATALHAEARTLLAPGGQYLVCDHFAGEGGMTDTALYMTVEEHRDALEQAGFTTVLERLRRGSLVLHRAC